MAAVRLTCPPGYHLEVVYSHQIDGDYVSYVCVKDGSGGGSTPPNPPPQGNGSAPLFPAPIPDFAWSMLTDNVVKFENTTLNTVGNNYGIAQALRWDLGDGSTSVDPSGPMHRYATPGDYNVTLIAVGQDGTQEFITHTVTVTGLPPHVDFTYISSQIFAQFTDASTVINSMWNWDFGDGTPHSHEKNPFHNFPLAGTYTVTLTTDKGTASKTIVIGSSALVAQIPISYAYSASLKGIAVDASNIYVGLLHGSGSTGKVSVYDKSTYVFLFDITQIDNAMGGNPDVSVDLTNLYTLSYTNYMYEFLTSTLSGTPANADHTFTGVGNYQIALAEDATYLYVLYKSQIDRYTLPASGSGSYVDSNTAPVTSSFSVHQGCGMAAGAGKLFITDKANNLLYIVDSATFAVTHTINISPRSLTGASTASPQHVDFDGTKIYVAVQGDDGSTSFQIFDSIGTFVSDVVGPGGVQFFGICVDATSVYLTGTDNNIYIYSKGSGGGPGVEPHVQTSQTVAGSTVTFGDESSGGATSWFWEFGDGTTSTDENPSHTYAHPGIYEVRLTITTPTGTYSRTWTVIILDTGLPQGLPNPPVAAISVTKTKLAVSESLTFADASTGSPDGWLWNFGDGNTSTSQNPTHAFSVAGQYHVTLTVSQSATGWTSTATIIIVVSNEATNYPPSARIIATPTSGFAPLSVAFNEIVGASDTVTYLWNFGDGTTSVLASVSHIFQKHGVYTVSLTVSNQYGQTSSTIEILVADTFVPPPGPPIETGNPYYYVINRTNETVLMYDIAGTYLGSFGGHGTVAGKFILPTTLTVVRTNIDS